MLMPRDIVIQKIIDGVEIIMELPIQMNYIIFLTGILC